MTPVEVTGIIVASLGSLASAVAVIIREIRRMKVAVIKASAEAHARTVSALTGSHPTAEIEVTPSDETEAVS